MIKKISTVLLFLIGQNANAGIVTLASIDINNSFTQSSNQTFQDYWINNSLGADAPTEIAFDTFTNIPTGNNKLNLLSIEISVPNDSSTLNLSAALDAHYGAEAYLNGVGIFTEYQDLWWQRDWQHSDVVTLAGISLANQTNLIEIFWAERCCNGPNSVMFSLNNNSPALLSESALNAAMEVHAPATLSLFMVGLFGLLKRRRNLKG